MKDLYLEKVQTFTTNNCFARSMLHVFCKMNMFLLSSLSNMIIDSASYWVGGCLVSGGLIGRSVVHGFNKTQEKTSLR